MAIKNLSLRSRLFIGYALPVVFLIVLIGGSSFIGVSVRSTFATTDANTSYISALTALKNSVLRLITSSNELILDAAYSDEALDEQDDIAAAREDFDTSLVAVNEATARGITYDAQTLAAIIAAGQSIADTSTEVSDYVESGAPIEDALELREFFEVQEDDFLTLIDAHIEQKQVELVTLRTVTEGTLAVVALIEMTLTVAAVVTSVATAIYLYRSITRPVDTLKNTVSEFERGNFGARTQIESNDEVGQLGNAFNKMADVLEQRQSKLSEVNTQLEQRLVELEEARKEAEHSNQVKSAFLASMSHELRTPLNAVINFTRFVVKGVMGPVNEKQVEALGRVIESAKHLLNLINDVLDMSKIESGSLTLFVEEDVNLDEVLTTVVTTAETLLTEKPVELKLEVGTLPLMTGDRQRILQIMLNIVSNACKFTSEGYVKISAHQREDEIWLSVEDTGSGIAQEDASEVFGAFRQTRSGLQQGGGTGLGMPISKHLAEAHGGRLWFESTQGKGSTFYVALPMKSEALAVLAV